MENTKYGRRRERRWTPIRAKAQDTRANPNSWETHLVRKRWDIGLLRALSPRIMMMMMMIMMMMIMMICLMCLGLLILLWFQSFLTDHTVSIVLYCIYTFIQRFLQCTPIRSASMQETQREESSVDRMKRGT